MVFIMMSAFSGLKKIVVTRSGEAQFRQTEVGAGNLETKTIDSDARKS